MIISITYSLKINCPTSEMLLPQYESDVIQHLLIILLIVLAPQNKFYFDVKGSVVKSLILPKSKYIPFTVI